MNKPAGRREAHKQATRAAIREAATRLFAQRGYGQTTVREIARAAGVTERTFYRYFDGKDGLLAEDALAWIDALRSAIVDRPADEPPFVAVRRALLAAASQAGVAFMPPPSEHGLDRAAGPFAFLQRAAPRPLRRLEDTITDALLTRLGPETAGAPTSALDVDLEARLVARVAVAALRTAANRLRDLRAAGAAYPDFERLLASTFATLTEHVCTDAANDPRP